MKTDIAQSYGFPGGYFAAWTNYSTWSIRNDNDTINYWGTVAWFMSTGFRNSTYGYLRQSSSDTYGICVGDYGE